MKKSFALMLSLCMLLSCTAVVSAEGVFTPGIYVGTGTGYAGLGSVTVTLPEEAATEADEAQADAEEDAEAPAEEAAEDAQAEEGALIITGDGEYALNGTTYVVTGLVLPEKTVENDNITITTANDEATLLNVAPVFEETDEDYDDIFSLFTMAQDDPTLLAKVFDLLGGVAYAEEDEDGRDLNVRVFKIGLEDVTTGRTYTLSCDFTERQKAMLKAGGLLAYTASK